MSKYWFKNEEQKMCIVPFENISKEKASLYRLENHNISFKQEVLDERKALRNVSECLITMLMDCRAKGKITLDEEDCKFLYRLASKEIQIDITKI